MSRIDFKIKGLGGLIRENKFFVPPYQRSFAWQELQVSQLFEDIENNINSSSE